MTIGTVQVNKDKAIQCAENYIKYFNNIKEKHEQRIIEHEMNKKWPFRAKNQEEAIQRAKSISHRLIFGESYLFKAEAIIDAAKLSNSKEITLDIDIASWFSGYEVAL